MQLGGLPGGERLRDSWAGWQNTWQLGLCGQQCLASGFPLLLWILFLGTDSQEDPPPPLKPGQESRNAYYGWLGVCLQCVRLTHRVEDTSDGHACPPSTPLTGFQVRVAPATPYPQISNMVPELPSCPLPYSKSTRSYHPFGCWGSQGAAQSPDL